jgi:DNA invertase Pin-like site-specific DNA recombinase
MQVAGSFAEFERSITKERINLGLARAQANGRIVGGRLQTFAYAAGRGDQDEGNRGLRWPRL